MPLAWDATIVHTCAPSYLHASATAVGSAASNAEDRKRAKYSGISDSAVFEPLAFETLGPFGPSARRVLDEIARRIRARTGEKSARSRLYRQLASAVQMGNAACVLEAHSQAR